MSVIAKAAKSLRRRSARRQRGDRSAYFASGAPARRTMRSVQCFHAWNGAVSGSLAARERLHNA